MYSPFSNVYGLARTLLALGTLLTLWTSSGDSLFRPLGRSAAEAGYLSGINHYGLFTLLAPRYELARWLAIAVLAVVASGWRPRFTGVLHWWVSASLFSAIIPQDGGDQCTTVLTLLLIPVTLSDPRAWHWSSIERRDDAIGLILARVASSSLFMVRVQVAILYLHAAVGKAAVTEWVNGTALYYWLMDPRIGLPTRYQDLGLAVLEPIWATPLITWSPMVLEYCLFLSLGMARQNPLRRYLLWAGLGFHLGNLLLFGLVSFVFAMSAALILLLRPVEQPFVLPFVKTRLSRLYGIFRGQQGFRTGLGQASGWVGRPSTSNHETAREKGG